MVMMVRIGIACMVVLFAAGSLSSCGGGGGGGGAPLSPPTYNLTGTWTVVETVHFNTAGLPDPTQIGYTLIANQAAGSNTVVIRDSRASIGDTQNATLSGTAFTYSGPRHSEFGCINMVATYNLTANSAISLSGTGRATCLDNGQYGDTTVTATK
jgi:hypothetical protein